MKYLGVEIKRNIHHVALGIAYENFKALECYFESKEEAKSHIREQILPLYQPNEALKWLEEMTGVKWKFEYTFNTLYVLNNNQWEEVYDFNDNTAYSIFSELGIKTEDNICGKWLEMTPREFIEKIEKGEWL